MDEQISEVLKRLESIERELSEVRGRLDALESGAASGVSQKKKPKKRLVLLIGIPLLILCLLVGGFVAFRTLQAGPFSGGNASASGADPFAGARIGDIVTFGKYEQNGSVADGPEPIEWIVLEKQNGKLLLVSRYILYNDTSAGKDWSINDLRRSLNSEFYSVAFLPEEQDRICVTNIESSHQTNDMLFLLSEEEVEKYFPNDDSRKCGFQYSTRESTSWWLRSCESIRSDKNGTLYRQIVVTPKGLLDHHTFNKDSMGVSSGIRPAMWVDTNP